MENFTFIHSADWHLGHSFLDEADRRLEHRAFFAELLEILNNENADALIVAGDIFDKINPSAFALKALYQFLGELHAKMPHVQTVLVAGNHDSALRLEAPREVLRYLNVAVVGAVNNPADLIIPLKNRAGDVAAFCLAVPFLRVSDIAPFIQESEECFYETGVAAFYETALSLVPNKNLPIIATAHCFVAGAQNSPDSERRLLIGGQESVSANVFPKSIDYVALGHLHRAQKISDKIFYSGSAIPLSFTERHYRHRVLKVEFEGKKLKNVLSIFLTRLVDFWQWPDDSSALSKQEILQKIADLPEKKTNDNVEEYPFLKIRLRFNAQDLFAASEVKKALENKAVRLMLLEQGVLEKGQGDSLESAQEQSLHILQKLNPKDLFIQLYRTQNDDAPPPPEWQDAFDELERMVERQEK